MERTLIILKPDAIQRKLVGQLVDRFERKGLKVVAMRFMQIGRKLAEQQYAVHKGKPFYDGLLKFMTSGPVVAMVLEGPAAVGICRKLMGATFGMDAQPGTIRGDFGCTKTYNLVHGSDSAETAAFEIPLYFDEKDFVEYTLDEAHWTKDAER